ncbi:MAG: type II toxin-antitoxin system VapC family toxin [bacterium]
MRAVVDTNVIAYLLLGTERFSEEAGGFMMALDDAWAPAIWEAELANTLWMAIRHKVLPLDEAAKRLSLADGLGIHSVSNKSLWQGALVRANSSNVAVYDTLFVELAIREHVPLATFDGGVLKAFPDVAVRPGSLIPA